MRGRFRPLMIVFAVIALIGAEMETCTQTVPNYDVWDELCDALAPNAGGKCDAWADCFSAPASQSDRFGICGRDLKDGDETLFTWEMAEAVRSCRHGGRGTFDRCAKELRACMAEGGTTAQCKDVICTQAL